MTIGTTEVTVSRADQPGPQRPGASGAKSGDSVLSSDAAAETRVDAGRRWLTLGLAAVVLAGVAWALLLLTDAQTGEPDVGSGDVRLQALRIGLVAAWGAVG